MIAPEKKATQGAAFGISRRAFVASVPLTAFALAACTPDGGTPAPTNGNGGGDADFTGTTLQVWAGATIAPPAADAATQWEELTGGKVEVTPVPFAERAIKFAGLVTAQDPSIDLLYAAGSFVGRFGSRLYEDLGHPDLGIDTSIYVPATLPVLSSNGTLCGLPIHSESMIYIYNKRMFEDAGLDPETPPDNWTDLYAAAAKLKSGDRFGCTIPWTTSLGTGAYYLIYLNSIDGAQLLSQDRTQVLFGDDNGLLAFERIEEGMKAGFFTPDLGQDFEDYATGKFFNDGNTASMINFAELWGYAVGTNTADFPTTLAPEDVGSAVVPGVNPGNSGSVNGFEGLGINKFSQQKEAALHFLEFVTGPVYQLEMNLAGTLPSSNSGVLDNPDVEAVYPVGPTIAAQGQGNLDRYASPFDWEPPISDALRQLYAGEITAKQAHTSAVAGVQKIVEDYLAN